MAEGVVALQSPGEILEKKLVVGAAAEIDGDGIVDEAVRFNVANAAHGMHKGTPFSVNAREARAGKSDILRNTGAVETAGIEHQSNMRKAREGEGLERTVPAAIALLVDDIGKLAVGNSGVDIAIRKQRAELCRHRNRKQYESQERQDRESSL